MKIKRDKVLPIILSALAEDIGSGDITTQLLFERQVNVTADIVANEVCIVAGIDCARWVFDSVDERIAFRPLCRDGDSIKRGKRVVSLKGSVKNIMAAERTALNFLGRISGVATLTAKFVEKVKGTGASIFDTRKTIPGWRMLEKYAVRIGGGCPHRLGLWDGVLIKDNHLEGVRCKMEGGRLAAIRDAVKMAKAGGYKEIEIEVENLREFRAALEAGADIIMLDNMSIKDIEKAVKIRTLQPSAFSLHPILEASGGVSLENVYRIARTGVDRISIGALTHSAPSIDFSLEICS